MTVFDLEGEMVRRGRGQGRRSLGLGRERWAWFTWVRSPTFDLVRRVWFVGFGAPAMAGRRGSGLFPGLGTRL